MEKKQNRSVQVPTKGVATESKKNQDVANGKYWPRGGRKREPVSGEPNRKPAPQRNKSMDKKPRARGGYYAAATCGKKNSWVAEEDTEVDPVLSTGNKKQILSQLLNFQYSPRGDNRWGSGGVLSRSASGSHRWFSTQKHKYNKEQFLQANCQFVVNSEGDYKSYLNNPDTLVDWDFVEQIHVQVSEFPSCPICLYPPVAAKMTRCGHVYCWSCILHYLTLSEKSWSKCPLCYESVHKNDLKSVIAIPHAAFNVSEHITLRLMKRAQGSLTAVPVDEAQINRNVLLNMSETKVNTVYSKLLLANSSEVMSIIDRERNELSAQLKECEDCPETCFIEQAINQLNDREKIVFEKISKSSATKISASKDNQLLDNTTKPIEKNLNTNSCSENRTRFESVSSEGLGSEDFETASNAPSTSDNNLFNNVKYYYFYQAADGQHIYLHAVNIRMLEHTYGSLDQCPTKLNGRIIEKEAASMTEELRKRLRCLQHLPLTCQFEVAEIQLRPPVVNRETLDHFQDQLETRKKRRQRSARDEKRREKRITDEENRRMGRIPEVNVHTESFYQFPQFGADDPALGACSSSTPFDKNVQMEEQYAGPSFAKMLVTGNAKARSWPGLSSPSQQDQPAPRLINVTGSQPTSNVRTTNAQSDSEPEPDGYVPAPAFNQSFSDAIALAFEKASISGKHVDGESCSGGKKKKKKKQKVLFATSMVYSGNN